MSKINNLILIIILIAADLATKYFAATTLGPRPFQILPFFKLQYVQNTGIAWSIAIPQAILIPLNFLILLFIPFYALKNLDLRHKISKIALALIIAGAIGNIYDRLFLGYVRDFIAIGWWPIFNLADSYLTIGIFLIFLFYGKILRKK